jgi:hypothetical protein
MKMFIDSPLTDLGLEKFLSDAKKNAGKAE